MKSDVLLCVNINILVRSTKVMHDLLLVTWIWFSHVGSADAGCHQNCQMSELPVSLYKLMFAALGLLCEYELKQN